MLFALHDRGLEAQLRGTDRSDVTARPAADDKDIERSISHLSSWSFRTATYLGTTSQNLGRKGMPNPKPAHAPSTLDLALPPDGQRSLVGWAPRGVA